MPVNEYFSQVQKEISSSTLIIDTRLTYEERSPYAGYISGTIVVEGGVEIQSKALSSSPEHKHTSDGKIIASHKPKLSTVILEAAKSVL